MTGARSIRLNLIDLKSSNGPYSWESIIQLKDLDNLNLNLIKGKAYGKQPVVLVFKTSNRSNAKTKIKIFRNENIDYIISS